MRTTLRHLLGRTASHKVFIVGTGRSGTHWLARILSRHPRFRVTIEAFPIFKVVRRMALDPPSRTLLYPTAVAYYRLQHLLSAPRHYADKSHPNLWLAERLARTFPDGRFLVIVRNPYATVGSMLRHEGVLGWHRQWREYPVPNRFLGIDRELADRYDDLSLAARCALRWRSHWEETVRLTGVLAPRMLVVR